MTMTPEQVDDHLEIERLHYEYTWHLDAAGAPEAQGILDCFTQDARWEAPDFNSVSVGWDEIRKQFSRLPYESPMHHFMTNVRIDLADDGVNAESNCYLLMYGRVKPRGDETEGRLVTRASRYEGSLKKIDGQWLFTRLAVIFQYGDSLKRPTT